MSAVLERDLTDVPYLLASHSYPGLQETRTEGTSLYIGKEEIGKMKNATLAELAAVLLRNSSRFSALVTSNMLAAERIR